MLRIGPIRLHWSLLLGGFLFCAAQPRPLLLLGYVLLLFAHVLGHLLATAGTRLRISAVMLHALGGELLGEGEVSPVRRSVIALSGTLAQLAVLAVAIRVAMPADLHDAFTRRNGVMLLLNLVPIKPLDGAQAWRLPRRLLAARRARLRPAMPSQRQVEKEVADLLSKIRR
jgi:stage IV sporulation protein FB